MIYFYRMKGSSKVIYNYDDANEFAPFIIANQLVDKQDHHVDMEMKVTHHEDYEAWLHGEEKHEDSQGWDQWKQNSWTQRGAAYGNNSGIGSSGDVYSIITMLKDICVEQQERHQEDSRRRDAFEAAQEERFRLIQEHMNS